MVDGVPRWVVFSVLQAMVSCLGAGMVPVVSWLYESKGEKRDGESEKESINCKILNYGLSMGAGAMICNSAHTLLPRNGGGSVFVGFLAGVCTSFGVDWIVHRYTSASLVHCGHGGEDGRVIYTDAEHESGGVSTVVETEGSALLGGRVISMSGYSCRTWVGENGVAGVDGVRTAGCKPAVVCHSDRRPTVVCLENNIGYDLENLATYRDRFMGVGELVTYGEGPRSAVCCGNAVGVDGTHASHGADAALSAAASAAAGNATGNATGNVVSTTAGAGAGTGNSGGPCNDDELHHHVYSEAVDHRHAVATPFTKLLSIGIQTCVVITLHKFPEGFIIFFTNEGNTGDDNSIDLGLTVFLGLIIHNFIEGFTMTLPLYSAFRNKWMAVLVTALLSAGSQPVGALIGYIMFNSKHFHDAKPDLSILLSVTAGFLFVVALQMFQTAVAFSDTHHHHEDDNGREFQNNHSSGTVCLKWCCLGVLLILASTALPSRGHG